MPVAGKIEVEVIAVVEIVVGAEHGRELPARTSVHGAQEGALRAGRRTSQRARLFSDRPLARTNSEMSTAFAWPCSESLAPLHVVHGPAAVGRRHLQLDKRHAEMRPRFELDDAGNPGSTAGIMEHLSRAAG